MFDIFAALSDRQLFAVMMATPCIALCAVFALNEALHIWLD